MEVGAVAAALAVAGLGGLRSCWLDATPAQRTPGARSSCRIWVGSNSIPPNGPVESQSLIRVAATQTWLKADPMNGPVHGDATCEVKIGVDVDLVES